jgi:hypothetical protein
MTVLTKTGINCKLQSCPLVREGAPHQQTCNCLTIIQIWLWLPRWVPDTMTELPLIVCRNATQIQVQVILRLMVSRPVRLGVIPLLERVTRCYISLSDSYFLSSRSRAPSPIAPMNRAIQPKVKVTLV